MSAKFKIGKRLIGDKYPPVVIAELGINHNGSLDLAIASLSQQSNLVQKLLSIKLM